MSSIFKITLRYRIAEVIPVKGGYNLVIERLVMTKFGPHYIFSDYKFVPKDQWDKIQKEIKEETLNLILK